MVDGPDKKRPFADGIRGQTALVEAIVRNLLKFPASPQHDASAFFALQVDAALGKDGGSRVVPADALLPMHLTGLGVHAGRNASIGNDIKLVTDQQRRGRVGRTARERPRDVRVGDIALSIRANRHHARPVEAGAHEKQSVAEKRPWDYRVTFAVTYPPNFVAGLGIVGADGSAARANDLFLSFDRDGQGRAARKGFLRLCLA